ncbi:MAG: helicase associated domain-containing protein [Verrucomicrobia bacterium]|nr:helicase associated domain-containing protein [Verrucomicrobiota bacterium]
MPARSTEREWYRWLDKLGAFRKQFGHCRVPPKWAGIPGLSTWVIEQRTRFHELELDQSGLATGEGRRIL